jgi:hypothetical protein
VLKDADVKKIIELTVTGIGVIIFIFLVISHMSAKAGRPVSKTEPYPASPAVVSVAGKAESWDSIKWGKDPFLLAESKVKEQGMEDLILNGIVSDQENPYAIINNDVVKLGDKVNDMTVIEINEKSVILEQDGQQALELNAY